LYQLCDIVFDLHAEDFREGLEDPDVYVLVFFPSICYFFGNNLFHFCFPQKIAPLGKDSEGRTYWYFKGTRLYRETPSKRTKNGEPLAWEVICEAKAEWEEIQDEFRNSKNKAEKELHQALNDLAARVAGKLSHREKQEKRMGTLSFFFSSSSSRVC